MSRQPPGYPPLERATVFFHSDLDDPVQWRATLAAALPQVEFVVGPACDSPEQVDIALVWTQPPQGLPGFPNLEPLPPEHPFWARPQLHVTPHVASLSDPVESAETVVANIRRSMQGLPLLHAIDRDRGY